jgi:hypothetical protein
MYPRISKIKESAKKAPKYTKAQIQEMRGEMITQPGEAITLQTVIEQMAKGFPVPMARQELQLPDDVNQILQGTNFDVPSDIAFTKMSKTERAQVLANMAGLKQQMAQKLDASIAAKKEADQKALAKEAELARAKAEAEAGAPVPPAQ